MIRPLLVMFAAAFVLVACGGQQKVGRPLLQHLLLDRVMVPI